MSRVGGGYSSAKYRGFTIGPESSGFELAFDSFQGNNSADGLTATPPLVFSTRDHDVNGCAAARGYPGWYGSDCAGYSHFADVLLWPVNETEVGEMYWANFVFERKSPYYED
ncbi:hypothetical protein BaRGS_00021460 [Batillaria attramentaria]|uniref:Fibrinogen C-terminal domain-containing protein n=1 Tax=Batillaria attramentaria TaxID=370345 RepID=A0ABD0KJI5_9CAEN